MLDIGWTELLVIAVVLIVVVGPKDLPPMLRAFGKMTTNLRKMAGDFRTQFDQALREADMDDVRQTISDAQRFNPANAIREAINPLREMGNEIRNDLQKATEVPQSGENRIGGEHTSTVDELLPTPELSLPETAPLVSPAPVAVAQSATGQAAAPAPAATPAAAAAAASVASAPLAVPAAKAIAPPDTADGPAAAAVKKPRAPRKQKVVVATAPEIETPAVKPAAKRTRVAKAAETGAGELAAVKPAPRRRKPTTPKDSA